MAQRIGLVLTRFDNDTAEVMTDKQGACGGCQEIRNCKSCLSGSDKVVAIVQNHAHAGPGDVVEIQHKSNALLGSAGLFYVLPVIGLLVGAFIGGAVAVHRGMDESVGAVFAGLTALVISLLAVIGFARTKFAQTYLVPRIVRVVERASNAPGSAGVKPACSGSQRPCCGG